MNSPCDPATLGLYPKDMKSWTQRDISTTMFTVALVIIAKTEKQLQCLLTDAWKKENVYAYNWILFNLKKI